jgi:hypothetical protein
MDLPMLTRWTASLVLLVGILTASTRAQDQAPPADAQPSVQQAQVTPPTQVTPPAQPTPPAQDAPPAPPTQEMQQVQQMQQVFQTILQNMLAKGIDPREFFQQIQNGADPAEIQKQLIDQGLIDKKTLDQLQSTMQSVTANRIKLQLDATDDDWKALWPLIRKVMAAAAAINGTRGGGGMAGFFTTPSATGADLSRTRRALRDALSNPATPPEKFTALLADFRDAREKAQAELDSTRQDLIDAVTVRQEGVLATMGILE